MKCELCKKELDAYLEGRLTEGTRALVDAHLKECSECAAVYMVDSIANKVMDGEKDLESNPFLVTRIMANIEQTELQRTEIKGIPVYSRVLRPAIIGMSIVAAITMGIFAGNAYSPNIPSSGMPQELAYIDDASLEGIAILTTE